MNTIINKWGVKAIVSEARAKEMEADGATIVEAAPHIPATPKPDIKQVSINELPNDEKFEAQGLNEVERHEKHNDVEEVVIEAPKKAPKKRGRPAKKAVVATVVEA